MNIIPNSNLLLLRDIPYNNDYKHVIKFNNEDDQYSYFISKVINGCYFTDFSYIRQRNVIRVPVLADMIYDCNYCMFKNVGFGNKWFYAFVTSVEYVDNVTSELTIEIDYYQTWQFEFTVGTCFVEREHVNDDTIGLHTVDEGIDFGENIPMYRDGGYFEDWKVFCQVRPPVYFEVVDDPLKYGWHQSYPETFYKKVTSQSDLDDVNTWLKVRMAAGYEVIGLYMCPDDFQVDDSPIASTLKLDRAEYNILTRPDRFQPFGTEYADSYIPKNKKLLCYPYNYLKAITHEGNSMNFKWEYNPYGAFSFKLYNNVLNNGGCYIEPSGYQGDNGDTLYRLPINSFPNVTWSINNFYQNLPLKAICGALTMAESTNAIGKIQAGSQMLTPKTKQLSKTGAKMMSEGYNELADLGGEVRNILAEGLSTPYDTSVANTDANLNLKYGRFGYTFFKMGIRIEYAKIIDDYFTRFGYKINRYKVPNLTGRRTFNYVKTVDCEISGNIPNEANVTLANIFDSGVTIWHTTNVGDYSANNGII